MEMYALNKLLRQSGAQKVMQKNVFKNHKAHINSFSTRKHFTNDKWLGYEKQNWRF